MRTKNNNTCFLYKEIIGFILVCILLTACAADKGIDIADFSESLYAPSYSSSFYIKGSEGHESTLITVKNPWQGAENVTTELLIKRGDESAPEGFTGQILNGEAKRIVAMSSTHIAMLDAVGATDRIVGVSGLDYISNPHIQARRDSIADVGYEGNINYELLLSLEPDLVLLYGVNGASSMESKLNELGVPYMYVGDYLEESPLGKAEWLVTLSEIVGKREQGQRIFADIPKRYNALKQKVSQSINPTPKVMVNLPYGDTWSMPSTKSYAARLIADAGGELVYKNNTGNESRPIDNEEAYKLTSTADLWINTGTLSSLSELKQALPKFADTPCVVSSRVFNNNLRSNPSGGNDYFETGVVRPDLVLRDLIKIFHPELIQEDFYFYQQLH